MWVMGYYTSWDSGSYTVSDIDWGGVTHVATAFYLPNGSGGWAAGSFDAGTAASLIAAAHANGKKVLASIGGSGSGASFEGSTSAAHLGTFVDNLAALLAMGYDGIDIDWEGGNLGTAGDQPLEAALIKALRARSPGALITMTAGFENENSVGSLSWYATVAPMLDRINLMTYGMSGTWSGWKSWHASPLHWNHDASTPTGIDTTVGHYLAAGVPAGKIGLGSGFYGECYTAPVTGPDQALGASQLVASDGTMSYKNIMATYYSAGAYHYDNAAQVPWLLLSGQNPQGCTFVTYEDATSIAAKGAWAKAQGLGGVIIWELAEGFLPSGATVQARSPLLEAMKTAFLQ